MIYAYFVFWAIRKRKRENPCGVCGHYHKYEEGEVCGICGHRILAFAEKTSIQVSTFSSKILPKWVGLGLRQSGLAGGPVTLRFKWTGSDETAR